jgi:hypothetical protein
VGTVGARGNVTGPHLHFERHRTASGGWSCGIVTDPAPSINAPANPGSDDDMPEFFVARPRARALPAGEWTTLEFDEGNDPADIVRPNDDPAGLRLGGYLYAITTHLTLTGVRSGSVIKVRTIQRSGGETTATHPVSEHIATSGNSLVQDSRTQRAGDTAARVRIQLMAEQGGQLTGGHVFGLVW